MRRLRRPDKATAGLIAGVCFAIGMAGVLLANQFSLRTDPPGNGNNGPGGTKYAIQAGQVLRVPTGAPAIPRFDVPSPPTIVSRVPAGSKRVALTFDSGWIFDTAAPILDVLKDYGLQVTFFPRGKWIDDHPGLVGRMLAEGHEIGSHSYTHPDLTKQTTEKVGQEIAQGKQALLGVAGDEAFIPLYRPPYGAHNSSISQVLGTYGYGWVVMWQVDSLDWKVEMSTQAIIDRVLGRVEDGGIVLMHIGRKETVESLPAIIDGLLARGYEIVRVTELLGIRHEGEPATTPYVVQKGDTLASLAGRFGTTVEQLVDLNPEVIK